MYYGEWSIGKRVILPLTKMQWVGTYSSGKAKQCESLTFLLKDNKLIRFCQSNPIVLFVSVSAKWFSAW